MNVIPVVATIFGAAYAVQKSYGIGFSKSVYLWIPVVGNIVAVLVIPYVGDLSDRIGRRLPMIVGAIGSGLLSFGYLYAISIRNVPLAIIMSHPDVGHRLSRLQRDFPELLPGAVSDPFARFGDGDWPEHRHDHHGACCPRCSRPSRRPGSTNIPITIGAITLAVTIISALAVPGVRAKNSASGWPISASPTRCRWKSPSTSVCGRRP